MLRMAELFVCVDSHSLPSSPLLPPQFNPLNRDTAYTKAPTDDDEDEFGLKGGGNKEAQGGWN
jgi:hypothetical protein